MKIKNILYIILMVLFLLLAYLFFDRGFNVRTKNIVNYQEKSDLNYRVYLHDNQIYDSNYLGMNERYITKLVDDILIDFDYNVLYDHDISGYYTYKVIATLCAYQGDINDSLWQKEYVLLNDNTKVLDANNLKNIKITDSVSIDYDMYLKELNDFISDYKIDVSGYLLVQILINKNLSFSGFEKIIRADNDIKILIPLSYDTFKINIINENHNINNYYDFSKKQPVNYLLLIIGAFCLSLGLSFLALTIRNMLFDIRRTNGYRRQLNEILNEYGDIIVKVKKFYSMKKYNLIYVDSFKELLDVYDTIKNPISYRDMMKSAIFLIIDDDNAWIYKLINK